MKKNKRFGGKTQDKRVNFIKTSKAFETIFVVYCKIFRIVFKQPLIGKPKSFLSRTFKIT